ncbi:aldehyde dehydrogenase family protein [Roseinatronobacter bogoriensis]|uniref:Aldehyde dehydrogenase n=1 Tax=Roseinatronobacter bogoriensis subsp. barguzinensis TaxID=441209 RepID=A0A2K8KDK0_9RHOB|nr:MULTISPECIES: aldehyde dehydrogenase family protein [Rhodobaca]ATX67537.1 aldehyde dehydrogenase [Rhodobaca barguzinensis]MBB4209689.1 aldehyde dehydrogenase (NAD+) [Rhodobaca bogoriensis DSM 18756]TDW33864.1 aldehyde dehydrogenase (NAD+) [Rhodobaca barguzinensis]TDY66286.1 aldehyde dehydrogenase (NAD+) [Rhodobaca bogoriensis DSM 18756]
MPSIKDIMETMEYGPAPESNAEVKDWLAGHADGISHFIGGHFVTPEGPMTTVINPADDSVLARLTKAGADQIDAAVKAARAAQPKWAALGGHARARFLYAIARHVQKRERFLAVLETMDNGKTIRETRDGDIPLVARHFYHHAGWAELLESEFPNHRPVGVCGQVIPWNFPLLMLAWKIAPALAAGNTVVLKPADLTPLTAQAFAEICADVGLPAGVVNIVHGDGETGALLTGHPDVDKVAFTGSTAVGRLIREQLAGSGKKLSLELGGKSPFIVFEDADLDAAVEGVVDAIWFNQGEVCCAGSRIIVQEGIAESFFSKLKARLSALRIGTPLDKTMDVGAVVSRPQLERIRALVATGEAEGAILHSAPAELPAQGTFCAPGFFTGTAPAHRVNQEEIFGPIATTLTFRTLEEAMQLANDTRYGLAATIWSQDIDRAISAAARVKAGVIWINSTNLFDAGAAFGGYRESGFGREGAREGVLEYLAPVLPGSRKERSDPKLVPTFAPRKTKHDVPAIDVTAKLYIGGKQKRADGGQSYSVTGKGGAIIGHAALGNRKDIRNAVEAAAKVGSWANVTGHNRAQVLYFLAENLSQRRAEFESLLIHSTGASSKSAAAEVEASIRRCFWYAAYADKFDGAVHTTRQRHVTLSLNEPWGIMGLVCPDERPLLSMLSLILPAIAMGNSVVAIASQSHPLVATTFYQVLETSDLPGGVVNLITGLREDLAKTLAEHDEVACIWYCGSAAGSAMVERAACGNLKATWTDLGHVRDWLADTEGQGAEYLRRATQIKTVWLPYGE